MSTAAQRHIDADFAEEVLADLYTYSRKREWLAFGLWLFLGWFGAHRFYLGRQGTGLLMLLTGGGVLFWWAADGFSVRQMVRNYNADQEIRRRTGLPPRELDFMPPLSRNVLSQPPAWTEQWRRSGALSRNARLGGDIVVLAITGALLGLVAVRAGVYEAVLAMVVIGVLTAAGTAGARLHDVPVLHELIRWNHRLRLFYYFNKPGTPLQLLFRPVTAAILAPFRRRDRAEVRLYLELGGVFTLLFLLADLAEELIAEGISALSPGSLFSLWVREATMTFLVIYSFATPIGAVLTVNLLMSRTHLLPRLLSLLVLGAMAAGLLL